MGAMQMQFVNKPVETVSNIQQIMGEIRSVPPKLRGEIPTNNEVTIANLDEIVKITEQQKEILEKESTIQDTLTKPQEMTQLHTLDTRGKIRDILR